MWPETILPGSGIRRSTESAVTDLPHQDSPTMPSVSPLLTTKLTPSTALTTPPEVKKWVLRSSTRSRGSSWRLPPHARVEGVSQAIPHEVEGHQRDAERRSRYQDDMR